MISLHTVFCHVYINLYSHQQWTSIHFSPYPTQHLLALVFLVLTLAILRDFVLSLPEAWVWSLVRELRFHRLNGTVKKKITKIKTIRKIKNVWTSAKLSSCWLFECGNRVSPWNSPSPILSASLHLFSWVLTGEHVLPSTVPPNYLELKNESVFLVGGLPTMPITAAHRPMKLKRSHPLVTVEIKL